MESEEGLQVIVAEIPGYAIACAHQDGDARPITIADAKNANPRRSVAWRFERATSLLNSSHRLPHKTLDDAYTKQLYRYLAFHREITAGGHDEDLTDLRMMQKFPQLHAAYKLFQSPTIDPMRYSIESRILARENHENIARKVRCSPKVVELYEKLFYDVRDWLDNSDYVATKVIGPVFRAGFDNVNQEQIAKYFGFFCGPLILDVILTAYTEGTHPKSLIESIGFIEAQVIKVIKTQALVTTTIMLPTKYDVRAIIEGFTQILAIERNSDQGSGGNGQTNQLTALIETIKTQNPLPRGDDAKKLGERWGNEYVVGVTELRAHEKNQAAMKGMASLGNLEARRQVVPPHIEGNLRVEPTDTPQPSS